MYSFEVSQRDASNKHHKLKEKYVKIVTSTLFEKKGSLNILYG